MYQRTVFVQPALRATTFVSNAESVSIRLYITKPSSQSTSISAEVWTNLKSTQWEGIPMQAITTHELIACQTKDEYIIFCIKIPANNIDPGWYEFTVRYRSSENNDWIWLSKYEGDNGKIFIGSKKLPKCNELSDILEFIEYDNWDNTKYQRDGICSWMISRNIARNREGYIMFPLGKIRNLVQYFGLQRLRYNLLISFFFFFLVS